MTFDLDSYANTMARYNQWMNGGLYSAAETLTLSSAGQSAACSSAPSTTP